MTYCPAEPENEGVMRVLGRPDGASPTLWVMS